MISGCRSYWRFAATALCALVLLVGGSVFAQDYASMGITPLVQLADSFLTQEQYSKAIPALEEIILRTKELTTPQGRETLQNARFQLGRALFQIGQSEKGMKVVEEYLASEPRTQERLALRLMAQGHLDAENWEKVAEVAGNLLEMPKLDSEDRLNASLLYGQAQFKLENWSECIQPLAYVYKSTDRANIRKISQVMSVRALVETAQWSELFGLIRSMYETDDKYDITLNITLMHAGKTLFEEAADKEAEAAKDDYMNALFLYRMVLPREQLIRFANQRITGLSEELEKRKRAGVGEGELVDRQEEIDAIKESLAQLKELPPYEDEVTFRIGQIYAEVKRFWEGYVLFDSLYEKDRKSEIGEAAILQSVLVLYDVGETERAEERVLRYLDEQPDGQYVRTLTSIMMRENLLKQNLDKVVQLREYVKKLPPADDAGEKQVGADLHYMLAFGFFQKQEFELAGQQFGTIIEDYPDNGSVGDAYYFRGMTKLMQGKYQEALIDFIHYQEEFETGEQYAPAVFREGVCLFGMEDFVEAEAVFTRFIEEHPDNALVSEAYSMRGDIEAAKDGADDPETPDIDEYDPHTLDRALADYRKAIDKYYLPEQAAYAAFQAAKVYKLEFRWQEIIDLMNYYMDLLGEKADVAQAVFWIGQAQIEEGQVEEAISAYLDTIERYGNEAEQQGIDKIVLGLVAIAKQHLSVEDTQGLVLKIDLRLNRLPKDSDVLKLRLRVAKAHLEGEDAATALGSELLSSQQDLSITTPVSLALMCDAAVLAQNAEQMGRLYDYFKQHFEESDELWHAYRAKTYQLLSEERFSDVLKIIDEVQGLFGVEPFMGWAQVIKASTLYRMELYTEAEDAYNTIMSVPEWRGSLFAEAIYGMARCRLAMEDYEAAHAYYQRTYMLYKAFDDGKWAADGYLGAADCLVRLGRIDDAVNTLDEMLKDNYVNTLPQADTARELKKKLMGA